MKRLTMVCVMLLCVLLTSSSWSHHAAEGIVSDEIWNMVDTLLEGSPHLDMDIDLPAVWDSMDVTMDLGYLTLVSSALVDTDRLDEYMAFVNSVVVATSGFVKGHTNSGTADTLLVDTLGMGDGTTLIIIYEPIGSGNSQVVPVNPSTGNRAKH